jgi:hypothetical protein
MLEQPAAGGAGPVNRLFDPSSIEMKVDTLGTSLVVCAMCASQFSDFIGVR